MVGKQNAHPSAQETATILGRIKKGLSSVRTTVFILIGIAVLSAVGTLLPQGGPAAEAISGKYTLLHTVFHALQFYDIFHSFWFALLALLLALNLICCTWYRLAGSPGKRFSGSRGADRAIRMPSSENAEIILSTTAFRDTVQRAECIIKKHFHRLYRKDHGHKTVLEGEKGALSAGFFAHTAVLLLR
ncbi:MAG: cytochrome c biogenesis protein ResB [Syntrophales bacterium]|jgi:cytochrome c biogenesis protein|nr:cytochrome c biogenesis protein ResB [Syntrophales bacterium]